MRFAIRAISTDQLVVQLTLDALDEADARRQAEARGLFPTSVVPAGAASIKSSFRFLPSSPFFLPLFSQELLALLRAGLSIVEALEALHEKEVQETTYTVLSRLLMGLREGKCFSAVLAEQPLLFPPLYVGIIQTAEGTSDLQQSLARFIEYRQRIDTLRSKIISAMIYPVILLVVGGGVTLFLICYVVPRFAQVYEGTGRTLPWLSQVLLEWGRYAAAHSASLAVSIVLLTTAAYAAIRRSFANGTLSGMLARLPAIGERIHIYALSRLYLTLGMLLEGGIPIIAALRTVEDVVPADIRIALRRASESIQNGVPMSMAFEAQRLATPISLRMLRAGERSGELGQMLTQSAAFYDGEISRWIDRFTRIFEPALMTIIGLIVGAIVVLLYMPIFDLAGSMS